MSSPSIKQTVGGGDYEDEDCVPGSDIPSTSALDTEDLSSSSALHELVAGCVAGSASVVVGHPFDTVKVRMQTSFSTAGKVVPKNWGMPRAASFSQRSGASKIGMSCRAESTSASTSVGFRFRPNLAVASSPPPWMPTARPSLVRSLYQGVAAPLSTAAVVNAVKFASYGAAVRAWEGALDDDGEARAEGFLSRADRTEAYRTYSPPWRSEEAKALACGCFSGAVKTLVVCPMEHVKCRLQIQGAQGSSSGGGVAQAFFRSAQGGGGAFRALFRGLGPTFLRDVPSTGVYFAVYEEVKSRLDALLLVWDGSLHSGVRGYASSSISGGMSGAICWAGVYPFDVVKSHVQTSPLHKPCPSTWQAGRDIVRAYGWRALYRGLPITLFRAFPVHGIIFPTYEFVLKSLKCNTLI